MTLLAMLGLVGCAAVIWAVWRDANDAEYVVTPAGQLFYPSWPPLVRTWPDGVREVFYNAHDKPEYIHPERTDES